MAYASSVNWDMKPPPDPSGEQFIVGAGKFIGDVAAVPAMVLLRQNKGEAVHTAPTLVVSLLFLYAVGWLVEVTTVASNSLPMSSGMPAEFAQGWRVYFNLVLLLGGWQLAANFRRMITGNLHHPFSRGDSYPFFYWLLRSRFMPKWMPVEAVQLWFEPLALFLVGYLLQIRFPLLGFLICFSACALFFVELRIQQRRRHLVLITIAAQMDAEAANAAPAAMLGTSATAAGIAEPSDNQIRGL